LCCCFVSFGKRLAVVGEAWISIGGLYERISRCLCPMLVAYGGPIRHYI
jgi:hypothetical protein